MQRNCHITLHSVNNVFMLLTTTTKFNHVRTLSGSAQTTARQLSNISKWLSMVRHSDWRNTVCTVIRYTHSSLCNEIKFSCIWKITENRTKLTYLPAFDLLNDSCLLLKVSHTDVPTRINTGMCVKCDHVYSCLFTYYFCHNTAIFLSFSSYEAM